MKSYTVKNPTNQTIELELDSRTALIFAPHEAKSVEEKYISKVQDPLVIVGEK